MVKRNKFFAIKSNGYDSRKENRRANELKLMERAGIIKNLQEQPVFELQPKFKNFSGDLIRNIRYVGDFSYFDNEKKKDVVEDVKSPFTRKLPVYILKKKIFMFQNPDILFLET